MNVTTFVDVLDQTIFEVAFVDSYPDWCSWCDHSQSGWGSLGKIPFWTFFMLSRAVFDHIDGLFRQKRISQEVTPPLHTDWDHEPYTIWISIATHQVEQTNSVSMLVVFLANFPLVLFECLFWNDVVDLCHKCKSSSFSWLAWAYVLSRFGWVTDVIEFSKKCIFWWFKPRKHDALQSFRCGLVWAQNLVCSCAGPKAFVLARLLLRQQWCNLCAKVGEEEVGPRAQWPSQPTWHKSFSHGVCHWWCPSGLN